MTEIRSGIRHGLALPHVYDFFQKLVGAYSWRKKVVNDFIIANVKDGGLIVDIGCGTAEVLSYLPSHVEYVGIDRNPLYIESARSCYADRNAKFYCEELSLDFALKSRTADVVLAFGLIHHLDDKMSANLFQTARKLLGMRGFLLTLDPVFTDTQSALARYIVSKDRGTEVRTVSAYENLALQEFSSVQVRIDTSPLHIPYTGIIMKCQT